MVSCTPKPQPGKKEEEEMITAVGDQLAEILEARPGEPRCLIEVLQDVQQTEGYISEEVMRAVSERLCVPLIEVYRVASFYKAFSLRPRGKHVITVCTGTACHVRGAPRMLDEVGGQLAVQPGQTTEDRLFTVESVNCLGACALGPVVVFDGVYHHHMTPGKLRELTRVVRDAEQEATQNV
jgi:NADH:ubiquinone oxidoreductase subunit E